MAEAGEHYLKAELYALVQRDASIFEFLQSGSLDGLWYWDMERPDEEWLSPGFKALFGYRDDEIPNTSAWWQDNIFAEDLPAVLERFELHLADPSVPYDQVVRYRHKDGSTVWVRCRGVAIRDDDGRPIRMLGCHTDVTALKQTELELQRRTARLERANRDLEQFTYIASHDMREPVRIIGCFAALLDERYGEQLDDEGATFLGYIRDSATRLGSMIDDMLALARSDHEQLRLDEIVLDELLARVTVTLSAQLEACGGEIVVPAALPVVVADEVKLERIVQNLVANALKFAQPDRAPQVAITAESDDHGWRLAVRDNGIGIDEAHHEAIFGMFRRLHPHQGGHGIGLAMVRKLAQLHGGDISVDSAPGQGSTFTVGLPRRPAPSSALPDRAQGRGHLRR